MIRSLPLPLASLLLAACATTEPGRALFDGRTLEGWTTTGGRYDGAAAWTVEDGMLVGRTGPDGEGGLIYTQTPHSAFELEFEVWLDYPYDSGVFTNMLPPGSGLKGLQVTLDHRPGGEIAGVYADGWLEHNPDGEALFHRDAWNHVRVRQTGFDPRLEVWINGQAALDFQLDPEAKGFARHGRIGLQVHPADASAASRAVRFRELRLRDLSVLGASLTPDHGWTDLLADGLEGFEARGTSEGYAVDGGVLAIPANGSGALATRASYGDFELCLDYTLAAVANSGLYLRGARDGGNPSYQGYEVQIIDDEGWEAAKQAPLLDYQKTAGLYAISGPVNPKPLRGPGEWNRLEVRARGRELSVALNGLIVQHLDLSSVEADPPIAERPTSGFLGLQRYGEPDVQSDVALEARRWLVRELP